MTPRPFVLIAPLVLLASLAWAAPVFAQSGAPSGRTAPTQTRTAPPPAPRPVDPAPAPSRPGRTPPASGPAAAPVRIQSFEETVFALLREGRYEEARAPAQAALAQSERSGQAIQLINPLMAMAIIEQHAGNFILAEGHARRALTLPPEQARLSGPWGALGEALQEQGRYDEAAEAFQNAIALNETEAGGANDLSNWLNLLAIVRGHQGLYVEGEELFHRAIAVAEANGADEARRVAAANLAWNLHQQRRHVEAEAALRRTIVDIRAAEGENAVNYGASVTNLAGELQAQGRHSEALVEFRRALPVFERALGRHHPQTAWTINAMARSVAEAESMEAAELLFLEAMGLSLATRPAGHPETTRLAVDMARHLMASHRDGDALRILRETGLIVRRRAAIADRRNATQAQREFDRHRDIYRLLVEASWDVASGGAADD